MKIMVLHLLKPLIGPRLRFPGLWGCPGPKPWVQIRKPRRGEIWGLVLGLRSVVDRTEGVERAKRHRAVW